MGDSPGSVACPLVTGCSHSIHLVNLKGLRLHLRYNLGIPPPAPWIWTLVLLKTLC